jgi:hypothetical protein
MPKTMNGRLERYANGRVVARITLSRRNLLTLLGKLDAGAPSADLTIWRDVGGGVVIAITAEEDDTHYRSRQPAGILPDSDAPLSPN